MSGPASPADGGDLGRIAQALDCTLTSAQTAQLELFIELLLRWNATYNLTAIRDPASVRVQHVADCLAVVAPVRRQLQPLLSRAGTSGAVGARLLDVGSGAGLPGVVLAVALGDEGLEVTCVDAVGKKVAFVRQAAADLGLARLHAVHARAERLSLPLFDIITSRAFASLSDFVRLTQAQLAPGGVWMAMKGRLPTQEMAALPADVEVFHVEPLTVPGLGAARCLIWMRRKEAT